MMINLLRMFENVALWVACAALLLMGAIVTASVVGRVVFNAPVPDDLIMVGLLMVCVIVLPLAYIERTDGHIVVTVISDWFPVRLQYLLRTVGNILFMGFFGTMGYMLALKVPGEFSENLYYDGHWDIPTWPMKAMFAAGVFILVLRCLISMWRNFQVVLTGRLPDQPAAQPKH